MKLLRAILRFLRRMTWRYDKEDFRGPEILSDGARLAEDVGELVFIGPKQRLQRHGLKLKPPIAAAML